MAFLSSLLFCICCFAEELIDLEPVRAQATITCGAITAKLAVGCNALPGCTWDASTSTCIVDDCLSFSATTTQAQVPGSAAVPADCECPITNFSWAHTAAAGCNSPVYDKKDTYCHNKNSVALDRCSYSYLYNQSVPAPYCKVEASYTDVAATANVNISKPVTGCETDGNGTLLNLCSCLGAWDSCTSYPKCYVSGTSCLADTCVDLATCATGCTAVDVYQPTINGLTITGNSLKPICVKTGSNETPNKCFSLVYLNETSSSSYCLPGITPNKDQCSAVEECSLLEDNLYVNYFGTKYFCTDAEHAAPGSGYLISVPSILAMLLIAVSFFL